MTTGHVFIATTLDGFIARKDHALDWLPQEQIEGEDLGYETFISSVDGRIMGRGTFAKVLTFGDWPYKKPVIVLSKTLTQDAIPDELEGKVRVSQLSPREIMKSLAEEGWKRVYIDGGQIVQSFFKEGLIEDMVITLIPILIGEGIRLFGKTDGDVNLKLVASQAFPSSGMVQNHYEILHSEPQNCSNRYL